MPTEHLPGINLHIPRSVPGVSSAVLNPRTTWTDPLQYDRKAAELIDLIEDIPSDRSSERGNEAGRLKALAQTEIESAAMWAVKAATKREPGEA